MNELVQQVLNYLRGMWQRRWIGLAAAWLAAIAGIAIVYRIPERYEASSRVYVDTESLLKPMLAGLTIQPNVDQQVLLISRTLISRPNVEKLVRMADLDLKVKSNRDREELIDSVTSSIKLSGGAGTNLYVITYRDTSPERARQVVQSLLAIFVESSLGDKRQDSRTAFKFLDDQIRHYETSLQAAEDRLKEFKLKYMGYSGHEGEDYFGRMTALKAAVDGARLELQAAEQSRDAYKRELAGEVPTFMPEAAAVEAAASDGVPEIDARIAALRAETDGLLRKYTEQHPDVLTAKRLIAQLEEQRRTIVEARRAAAAAKGVTAAVGSPAERNPVFQQLRLSLAEAEATVASARAKVAGHEEKLRQLQAQAQLAPKVEAEFAQLNRDYAVQKKTYENLLSRREAAAMGLGVQDAGGAQFRVIDPPRVQPTPVAPNRFVLLLVAFAGSLVFGMVASFVASQLLPTFHDARMLRDLTKRPILGMVSMLPRPSVIRQRRRRTVLFAGGTVGLVASFSAVLMLALLAARI
jgi:polysaccharide chain length determinant protein (PEP-CTERM system associated)